MSLLPPCARDWLARPIIDPRRVPFRDAVRGACRRFGGDLLIAETAHVDHRRGPWLRELAGEVAALWEDGVPVHGICLYPVLGMPEWHAPGQWTCMGLWDVERDEDGTLHRVPCEPMLNALRDAEVLERHPSFRSSGR